MFRGPARKLHGNYIAFLGGSETFGRYIPTPFPDLIEKRTGVTSVNLGCIDAGLDCYAPSHDLLDICSNATATVIQILGATNMSNRFYTVNQRHSNRFLRASKKFKEIYPEIDFSTFTHISEMLGKLGKTDPDRLQALRQEIQTAWVARMRALLRNIQGPKILLWLADHAPFSSATGGTICRMPLFVDRAMLNALKTDDTSLLEVVATPDEIRAGHAKMIFTPQDAHHLPEILGPLVHERVAAQLAPLLSNILPDIEPDIEPDEDPFEENIFENEIFAT
jgi:hypothetical protein